MTCVAQNVASGAGHHSSPPGVPGRNGGAASNALSSTSGSAPEMIGNSPLMAQMAFSSRSPCPPNAGGISLKTAVNIQSARLEECVRRLDGTKSSISRLNSERRAIATATLASLREALSEALKRVDEAECRVSEVAVAGLVALRRVDARLNPLLKVDASGNDVESSALPLESALHDAEHAVTSAISEAREALTKLTEEAGSRAKRLALMETVLMEAERDCDRIVEEAERLSLDARGLHADAKLLLQKAEIELDSSADVRRRMDEAFDCGTRDIASQMALKQEREKGLLGKEMELRVLESKLNVLESTVASREEAVEMRERAASERERALSKREVALAARSRASEPVKSRFTFHL